jgi:hypothetical protein
MSLELISQTDPVDVAWAAYDDAMLRLQHAYDTHSIAPDARAARRAIALEARERWRAFINLYEGPTAPERPAA